MSIFIQRCLCRTLYQCHQSRRVVGNVSYILSRFNAKIRLKWQGRPQDLTGGGRGARNIFFGFGNLLVTGEAMRFAGGVQGHAPPPENFF